MLTKNFTQGSPRAEGYCYGQVCLSVRLSVFFIRDINGCLQESAYVSAYDGFPVLKN